MHEHADAHGGMRSPGAEVIGCCKPPDIGIGNPTFVGWCKPPKEWLALSTPCHLSNPLLILIALKIKHLHGPLNKSRGLTDASTVKKKSAQQRKEVHRTPCDWR